MKSQDIQKVFVGMSGGVDSSVSAALLKQAGYDVTGVFIKVWQPDWIECNWREERYEAMRVAAHLGIPFVTLDLEKEYKQGVIDYMIAEYAAGRTPNPDVMCNREVKFGAFWKWAKEQGADFIATGHYARVVISDKLQVASKDKPRLATRNLLLATGIDANKDQSYFLWTLNQDDLKHVLFPVGHLEKPEVRMLAKRFKLPNSGKKDSQGLCFIGKLDVKEFLKHYIKTDRGDVLNETGEVVGFHEGALLLTIGERHGFTITKKTPNDEAVYIVAKDVKKNTITVSQRKITSDKLHETSKGQQISIKRVNWVGSIPADGAVLQARTRYRQALQDIKIVSVNGKGGNGQGSAIVEFKSHQDTITPGQSLVMYGPVGKNSDSDAEDSQECVGGGIIE